MFICIILLVPVLPGFALRTGNVYSVGNALKGMAPPRNRLSLADFRRASLRIRYRGSRRDTIYVGPRFAALIAGVRGSSSGIDRVLRAFPPGRLAARLRYLLSRSAGGLIVNLGGVRYRIGSGTAGGFRHQAIVLPAHVWKGAVLATAVRGARNLALSAGGRSVRYEPADLRGVVLSVLFRGGRMRTWRGAQAGYVLSRAVGHHTLFGASPMLLSRALQNLANWGGVARLHVPGHPPVRIRAAARVMAEFRKERDRIRTEGEILAMLRGLVKLRRYRTEKKILPYTEVKTSKKINERDFLLLAENLFHRNSFETAILAVRPPAKSKRRKLFFICAYRRKGKMLWNHVSATRGTGNRLTVVSGSKPAPHYSQLPAFIFSSAVRFLKVQSARWRLGKNDPVLQRRKYDNWALSTRR